MSILVCRDTVVSELTRRQPSVRIVTSNGRRFPGIFPRHRFRCQPPFGCCLTEAHVRLPDVRRPGWIPCAVGKPGGVPGAWRPHLRRNPDVSREDRGRRGRCVRTDAGGNPIAGLTAEDFEVVEAGDDVLSRARRKCDCRCPRRVSSRTTGRSSPMSHQHAPRRSHVHLRLR